MAQSTSTYDFHFGLGSSQPDGRGLWLNTTIGANLIPKDRQGWTGSFQIERLQEFGGKDDGGDLNDIISLISLMGGYQWRLGLNGDQTLAMVRLQTGFGFSVIRDNYEDQFSGQRVSEPEESVAIPLQMAWIFPWIKGWHWGFIINANFNDNANTVGAMITASYMIDYEEEEVAPEEKRRKKRKRRRR
jgi:hypothetical protein